MKIKQRLTSVKLAQERGIGERVRFKLKNGKYSDLYTISKAYPPANAHSRWHYDVRDEYGNTKKISEAIIVG
jgi:hypothetical protein